MKLKIYVFLSLTWILSAGMALAQSAKGPLTGKVTDGSTKEPLPGANVLIVETNRVAITDDKGRFTIPDLTNGRFHLQVSYIGYATQVQTIVIGETTKDIQVALEPSVYSTNEIVVSGAYATEKERSPIPIETIEPKSFVRSGATSMIEGLTLIPGVQQISFGTGIGKPVIRGLAFSRVLTIYQGTRFENHQWGADHGLGLNDFGIHRVEVVKGPASLVYGSGAVGGVLNIIDERPPVNGEILGDYNISAHSNTLGIKTNLGIRGTTENGFYWRIRGGLENHADYLDGRGVAIGNSRYGVHNLKTSIGVNKSWGSTYLNYTYHRQRLGIIEEDENTHSLATFRNDRKRQLPFQDVTDHVLSSQSQVFLGKSRLKLNMTYHANLREEIEGSFDEVDLGLAQRNFTYDLKYYLPSQQNAEYVIGVQGFRLSNTNYEDAGEFLIPDALIQDYSVFGMVNYEWERFNLQGGIRYDLRFTEADASAAKFINYGYELPGKPENRRLEKSFSGFSGSVGATYKLTPQWSIRSNLASGFRAPDLAELFSNGPHPGTNRFEVGSIDFDREQNLQFDLSTIYNGQNWAFDIGGFANAVQNYVFFGPTGRMQDNLIIWQFEQDHVVLYGGEASVEFRPQTAKWFKIKTDFSTVIAERMESGEPLPLIPANRFTHEVSFRREKIGTIRQPYLQVRLQNVFAQNRIDSKELATPAYNLLSMGIGGNVMLGSQALELSLAGNNLLNARYLDHLSLLRPFNILNMGRNINLNVRVPFQIR